MNNLKTLIKVEKFVDKKLCHLDNFHLVDNIQNTGLNIELKQGEKIIGIYHNHPNNENLVVVTDLGLYLESNGEWKYLDYMLMKGVSTPIYYDRNKKGSNRYINPKRLVITVEGGPDFILPIINEDKGWDIFAFHMFLKKFFFWIYRLKI